MNPTSQSSTRRIKLPQGRFRRWGCFFLLILLLIVLAGLLVPETMVIPVKGATTADWNHQTFWYHPWGESGVHKGIDIFAKTDTPVLAATAGWVLSTDTHPRGGNVVLILGPKWRLHYYAHLHSIGVDSGAWVSRGEPIATVGATGNAKGKPAHLHYSIVTPLPYIWRIDGSPQGWKKVFFLNPSRKLLDRK